MILDPNLHCWEALNNNFVELVEQKNQTPTRQKMVHFHIDSRLTEALLSRKHVDFQIYTVGRTFWQQTCSQGGINLDPRNFWGVGFFFEKVGLRWVKSRGNASGTKKGIHFLYIKYGTFYILKKSTLRIPAYAI